LLLKKNSNSFWKNEEIGVRYLLTENKVAQIKYLAPYIHTLQGFAYRTTIVLGTFIFSAILAMFIAICTVLYQSIKAATANPADAIRYK
jgi:ABC-type antimicrobial peptide transport system permease subunit